MPDILDLDIQTNLRGPLAEKLVKLARRHDKTPVDMLADLMLHVLNSGWPPVDVNAFTDKHKQDASTIAQLNAGLHSLRKRYACVVVQIPAPDSLVLRIKPQAFTALAQQAAKRKKKLDDFVALIIETVVLDDLFAAVLDN